MKRNNLFYVAAAIWGIPGVIITIKGISAYTRMPAGNLWWLILITLVVLMGFFIMFHRIVVKYSRLINALPENTSILKTFPLKGWILIIFMMCLGMALKFFPGIPEAFTASFYSGLGPALLYSAFLFAFKGRRF